MIRKVAAIAVVLVGLAGLTHVVMAQDPVYFADANLKAAVERELGIPDPTPTDMLLLIGLDAMSCGIADLTGIEYATNLTHLFLSQNRINDISAISGLNNLTMLLLDNNQISTISALSGLTNLTWLDLSNNQISDISALSGLPHLSFLILSGNQISDISALAELVNLSLLKH